jgi:hypothetical protein
MNCVKNEKVDNLVWSCYRENSAEFFVKKNYTEEKLTLVSKYIFLGHDISIIEGVFKNVIMFAFQDVFYSEM